MEDENDDWAIVLILVPTGENAHEYRRVGLPLWENSFFLDGNASGIIV
jgi:hypothetical protein